MKGITSAREMLETTNRISVRQLGEGQLSMLKAMKKSKIIGIIKGFSRQFREIYQLIRM